MIRSAAVNVLAGSVVFLGLAPSADARLLRLEIERREVILDGRLFGAEAALSLVEQRYLLATDLPDILERAAAHYDWAVSEP